MIKSLQIENFKSIKSLQLDCKRVNVFIGEPNTGKSNILEAIGLLSHICHGDIRQRQFIRFENMTDLFYDHILDNNIKIGFDEKALEIKFKDGNFIGSYLGGKEQYPEFFRYNYQGSGSRTSHPDFSEFKLYRFTTRESFPDHRSEFLLLNGDNLLAVVLARKELRVLIKQIFDRFGFTLVFEPEEGRIMVQKQLEDIIIAFPYSLASETLQRLVFYLTAIHSNKNSVLAFEEPEAHAFPYYTKYLAEIIALDKNKNQYFISTHNPYFLLSILEKTPKNEIAVFNTYLENYQTKVKALTEDQMKEVLDKGIDLFFDLERFLG